MLIFIFIFIFQNKLFAMPKEVLEATKEPRSNSIEQSYWIRAINWTPGLLDESGRPKIWQIKAKPTWHHLVEFLSIENLRK